MCPPNTQSVPGNTGSLLGCRCLGGFTCSYTKRLAVTVRIVNMTQANFTTNYQTSFMRAIAGAAGVSVSQVTMVGAISGRRLLSFYSPATSDDSGKGVTWGHHPQPQELTVKFHVRDSDYLEHIQTLDVEMELAWEHAHDMHVKRQL